MSKLLKWAESELRYAGYDVNAPKDGPNKWAAEDTLELLKVFSDQGHSGMSAPYIVSLFKNLAMWKPIAPLTGDDSEWMQVSDDLWQSNRNSMVFKNKDGQAYWSEGRIFWEWASFPDIDNGAPYKVYYTSKDSRVNIEFPWSEPEPEYVFSPTEQFPNEMLDNDV